MLRFEQRPVKRQHKRLPLIPLHRAPRVTRCSPAGSHHSPGANVVPPLCGWSIEFGEMLVVPNNASEVSDGCRYEVRVPDSFVHSNRMACPSILAYSNAIYHIVALGMAGGVDAFRRSDLLRPRWSCVGLGISLAQSPCELFNHLGLRGNSWHSFTLTPGYNLPLLRSYFRIIAAPNSLLVWTTSYKVRQNEIDRGSWSLIAYC